MLLERGAGHLVKVILRADDSNGMFGDLARRVLDLHAEACDAQVADPVGLAKWMLKFSFVDQDFFFADTVRYAAALDERGLDHYRTEVGKRSVTDGDEFAIRHAQERLAVLYRDVPRIIELLGGDLSTPHRYISVAEAMLEIDRSDDALHWARRGIGETHGWQVARLYDIAADVHTARGEPEAAFDLRRRQHREMTSSTTYALLRAAAEACGRWDVERDDARAALLAKDRGGLVDALLADGETETAWANAVADTAWDPGDQRWQRLAEAREPTNPGDATGVYLLLADRALLDANRGAYQVAIRRLKHARRSAAAAGTEHVVTEHVAALREIYRRRPSLIAMLDKARL